MADLKAMGEKCGFAKARTFIASGNLLFESEFSEAEVKKRLAAEIEHYFGEAVPIFVRTAAEMAAVVADNPFKDEPGNRVAAHFLNGKPTPAVIEAATGATGEQLAPGAREIYVFYPDGMGNSKLKLRALAEGTARNMNSVAKMAGLLA